MTYTTHSLGGAAAGFLTVGMLGPLDEMGYACVVSGAVIGSLVPDLDHTKSKISRSSMAASVTSYAASTLFKHRGFLHTPLFVALMAALMLLAIQILQGMAYHETAMFFGIGLIPGMLSHLLLDTLNPGGIMWLWPFSKKRIHIVAIKTNSLGEKAFAALFLVVIAGTFFF